SRGLDASLPPAPPHDESDGVERRPNDTRGVGYSSRRQHGRGNGDVARGTRYRRKQSAKRRARARRWIDFGDGARERAVDANRSRQSNGEHARHGSREDAGNEDARVTKECESSAAISTGRLHGRSNDGHGPGG